MKHINFYLDFLSPYAYLAFERLPQVLSGLSYRVSHKPVLLSALLQRQRGPVEIAHQREWTYRHVLWLAQQHGIRLELPASHPFNPIALLRLALACNAQGQPNRHATGAVFRHVWHGGAEASDGPRLQALTAQLAPERAADSTEVKAQLHAHSDEALALGVFGVPSFVVDGKLFWGLDALPMLRAYLAGEAWFDGPAWDAADRVK